MKQEKNETFRYVDNPNLQELYANHLHYLGYEHGVIHIELTAVREDPMNPGQRIVQPVVRLAMPAGGALQLAEKLRKYCDDVRKEQDAPARKQ